MHVRGDLGPAGPAGMYHAGYRFAEGELVRISRRARRGEGTPEAVMWRDSCVPDILAVPWDGIGIVLGNSVLGNSWEVTGEVTGKARHLGGSAGGDAGPVLLRVAFPQGVGLWWPEYFEPVARRRY